MRDSYLMSKRRLQTMKKDCFKNITYGVCGVLADKNK